MVNFRNIADRAKGVVEKRGGSESLKRDAEELKSIAKGPGTISEKAKAAASALKEPGARRGAAAAEGEAKPAPAAAAKPTPKQAAGQAKAGAAQRTGAKPEATPRRPPEESGGAK